MRIVKFDFMVILNMNEINSIATVIFLHIPPSSQNLHLRFYPLLNPAIKGLLQCTAYVLRGPWA